MNPPQVYMWCLKKRVKCKKGICLELFLRVVGCNVTQTQRNMKESVKWTMTLLFLTFLVPENILQKNISAVFLFL